jgi:hypothetical protein
VARPAPDLIRGFREARLRMAKSCDRTARKRLKTFLEGKTTIIYRSGSVREQWGWIRLFEYGKIPEKGGVHSQEKEKVILEEVAVLI